MVQPGFDVFRPDGTLDVYHDTGGDFVHLDRDQGCQIAAFAPVREVGTVETLFRIVGYLSHVLVVPVVLTEALDVDDVFVGGGQDVVHHGLGHLVRKVLLPFEEHWLPVFLPEDIDW